MVSAQDSKLSHLSRLADRTLYLKDYASAKPLYKRLTEVDSLNNNNWYGLGLCELKLGEKEIGCQHLHKSYKMGNSEAPPYLQIECEDFPEYFVMTVHYTETKPKFVYEGETYSLFTENKISEKFKSIMQKELRKSDFIRSKMKSKKLYVGFHIDKQGKFDGDVMSLDFPPDLIKSIKPEVRRIFQSIKYEPAIYKGQQVEICNNYLLRFEI